jgi:hypothetical protein
MRKHATHNGLDVASVSGIPAIIPAVELPFFQRDSTIQLRKPQ